MVKTVKTPKLVPSLEAGGYELLMHNRPSEEYDIMKGYKIIGRIRVHLQCVVANTGTEMYYVPYGIDVEIIQSSEDLPIELFEKMIMVTTTIS